ncbi:MAG: MliC family protein [Candidatus Azobacteroides sp.]|nr:MliC family protein [Candidatus Azobacteroides sp.]
MIKKLFTFALVTGTLLTACNNNRPAEHAIETNDVIVTNTVKDHEGNPLDMSYNNTKGTATFHYRGDTIHLKQDTMASGIRYSNDEYEYSEWHGQMTLKRNGKVIYTNDDVVNSSVTDKNGVPLNMSFNNTRGTATLNLNGEDIELQQDTTASGTRYRNNDYEYTDHQGNIVLKKGNKTVYEYKK